jgi:hypothetical protein
MNHERLADIPEKKRTASMSNPTPNTHADARPRSMLMRSIAFTSDRGISNGTDSGFAVAVPRDCKKAVMTKVESDMM